jgi:hemerythrin-like domain-containing protein
MGLAAGPLPVHAAATKKDEDALAVTAAEDLMREHGVLRRALLVYVEAASRLERGVTDVSAEALMLTAQLSRHFGEDCHERGLEEAHVFPAVVKAGGKHAALARTLIAQYARGREVTEHIAAVTRSGRIGRADSAPLAQILTGFVRMYQHHAAIEDTVIFPAWKAAISADQYEDLNEFEELEHKLSGEDGFDDAIKQVATAERAFALADLAELTAPAPPN